MDHVATALRPGAARCAARTAPASATPTPTPTRRITRGRSRISSGTRLCIARFGAGRWTRENRWRCGRHSGRRRLGLARLGCGLGRLGRLGPFFAGRRRVGRLGRGCCRCSRRSGRRVALNAFSACFPMRLGARILRGALVAALEDRHLVRVSFGLAFALGILQSLLFTARRFLLGAPPAVKKVEQRRALRLLGGRRLRRRSWGWCRLERRDKRLILGCCVSAVSLHTLFDRARNRLGRAPHAWHELDRCIVNDRMVFGACVSGARTLGVLEDAPMEAAVEGQKRGRGKKVNVCACVGWCLARPASVGAHVPPRWRAGHKRRIVGRRWCLVGGRLCVACATHPRRDALPERVFCELRR